MKRILIIFLALILVACGVAPAAQTQQPVAAQPEPSQTPVVVVITATNAPATEVPPTEPPPPTEVPPTAVPPTAVPPTAAAPTEAAAAPTQAAPDANAPISVDEKLGAGWFVNMTRSRNDFSLRCQLNKEITFSVQVTSDTIKSVDLWYRFEDRATGAIFEWTNFGKMVPDLEGSYTITISGDQTNPNFRKPNSYFDYQFVAYNPNGVIGRSEKIERQVTFTFDCP